MLAELVVFECLLAFVGLSLALGDVIAAAIALTITNLLAIHIFAVLTGRR